MSPELAAAKADYCARDRWFDLCYNHPQARIASAEQLIASMDKAGVHYSVVAGFAFENGALCAASNDYVIDAVKRYPDRLIGLAAVQPLDGMQAVYEVERCLKAGLAGVGELLPDGQNFDPTATPAMTPLMEFLQSQACPVMIHTSEPVGHLYPGKGVTWPHKIVALAGAFPELKIIAAHWGGGLPFYELMPEVKNALRNLYYDTAATSYLYEFKVFRAVADTCGAAKILFASDYPLLKQGRLIGRVQAEGGLTAEELRLVLGLNAAHLFGLKIAEVQA